MIRHKIYNYDINRLAYLLWNHRVYSLLHFFQDFFIMKHTIGLLKLHNAVIVILSLALYYYLII